MASAAALNKVTVIATICVMLVISSMGLLVEENVLFSSGSVMQRRRQYSVNRRRAALRSADTRRVHAELLRKVHGGEMQTK